MWWEPGGPRACAISSPSGVAAKWLAPTRGRADDAPTADAALAALTAALDVVAAVDWDAEAAAVLADAPEVLQRLANRVAAAQIGCLTAVDGRGVYALDGSVSMAAWLANRTNTEHSTATRLVSAARRIGSLPLLGRALADGDITVDHVTAVTSAAVPTRAQTFAASDGIFAQLARSSRPSKVRLAARFLSDQIDPDGSKPKPDTGDCSGKEPRRHVDVWDTIDDLLDGRLLLDKLDGELFRTLLDAFDQPDPPDTPEHLRRSPGQRRADALVAILKAAAASKDAPTVHGAKPAALAMFDLARFLGRADLATFTDQLRHGGEIDHTMLARLLDDATVTVVLTLGPWRVVNVGRTFRTLPAALRPALQMLHLHCRGPDCDRPATWCQVHHETGWHDGGDTDLNQSLPLCQAHHTLVTSGGWTVELDHDTGNTIWTAPDGRTITVAPDATRT